MQVTAVLTPDPDGGFVAYNPETGTATQGDSLEDALSNLKEAVELYLEEFPMKPAGAPFVTMLDVKEHA
jgi:predicted RNase H-like HicB family nuclease